MCKIRVDTKWWCLQNTCKAKQLFYEVSCEFGARLKDFGVSDAVLGVWVWVMLQAATWKRKRSSGAVWFFLLELIWGFHLGWPFWCSYSMKSMDFPLSCSSGCAWSWQQWTLTPFKTTTFYCTSGESLGGWYFSVATAWILLFLLSSSPGFWRPFNSPLYLPTAHNSQAQHCVLCICWHSHFFKITCW